MPWLVGCEACHVCIEKGHHDDDSGEELLPSSGQWRQWIESGVLYLAPDDPETLSGPLCMYTALFVMFTYIYHMSIFG